MTPRKISLDFITGLPPSLGHSVILVVVDCFSKGAHFGTLPPHFTTFKVAQLFMNMVCASTMASCTT